MRKLLIILAAALAAPAAAQDSAEIIVTGTRSDGEFYSDDAPLIGLKRAADFAVRPVRITSDSRDPQRRRDEIFAMLKSAIDRAPAARVELAFGDYVVEPLTAGNYRNLPVGGDSRPDTSQVSFLVKTPLAGMDGKAALDRIESFIKAVPASGRSEMLPTGDLTLSVVGPEQYRPQILDLVAADARTVAGRFGPDYRVELRGADQAVAWSRASLTEVFLYVPYNYSVTPGR